MSSQLHEQPLAVIAAGALQTLPHPCRPRSEYATLATSTRRIASSHVRALHGMPELEHCHTLQNTHHKTSKHIVTLSFGSPHPWAGQ